MIRAATREDAALFETLWREALQNQYEQGGEILPTRRSLAFYRSVFERYVRGLAQGVALFGGDENAVLLWGAFESPFDLSYGKVAQGWGTYVRPSHERQGIAQAMRSQAITELRRMGFAALIGSCLLENERGLKTSERMGMVWTQKQGVLEL